MPSDQKWWFSLCLGYQLIQNELVGDYGYEKSGYCRHVKVDQLLFDTVNRFRKSALFKKKASEYYIGERKALKRLYFRVN